MKKNSYNNLCRHLLRTLWGTALLPLLLSGCLYEGTELTTDGEEGIDPTAVTLEANLSITFEMPAIEKGGQPLQRPSAGDEPAYRHRFVVDAYIDRMLAQRQVIYHDVTDGATTLNLPVTMKLHARPYQIAVWSDYVQTPDAEAGISGTDDYFWNCSTMMNLLTVYGSDTYRANNEWKDAYCGYAEVDLSEYRGEWNVKQTVGLELKRPVARFALVANDVAAFLGRIASGQLTGTSFVLRLRYADYLNQGYNVPERLARHGLLYLSADRTFKVDDLKAGEPYALAFDYVLAADEGNTVIPLIVEVLDSSKTNVLASTGFNLFCRAGYHTTVTYGFLTSSGEGGIIFNPDFEGSDEIVIHPEEAD